MGKTKKKQFAIIDNKLSTITLSDSMNHFPIWNTVFSKYELSEDKTVIEGEVFDYVFEIHRDTPLELIDDSQIKEKKFLWWRWKSCKSGWTLLKKRKPMKITNPKGFIVIEGER